MPAVNEYVLSAEDLQRELSRLREEFATRVSELERRLAAKRPEVTPEIVAIIAAAATSFLGKKVKLRSIRQLEPGVSPWAQQGRAIIQASHNLVR